MRSLRRLSILLCAIGSGCAGRPSGAPGFINRTRHSDAQLSALWKSAQKSVSQQIDLNPLQQQLGNAAPDLLPGDARAWKLTPRQLVVSPQPDVSSAALLAATGESMSDPTGLITCAQPCNVRYAPAYSRYTQPSVNYAASWESSESNFDFLVEYEFENQILNTLGYDTSWR